MTAAVTRYPRGADRSSASRACPARALSAIGRLAHVWRRRGVGALPPWAVLVLLVLPLVVVEPMKALGLYALATKRIVWGVGLQAAGYGLHVLLVERVLHAGHRKLTKYRWFMLLDRAWRAMRARTRRWPSFRFVRRVQTTLIRSWRSWRDGGQPVR